VQELAEEVVGGIQGAIMLARALDNPGAFRVNDHKSRDQAALLPWNWRKPMPSRAEAA
jgi:hypothetical protein